MIIRAIGAGTTSLPTPFKSTQTASPQFRTPPPAPKAVVIDDFNKEVWLGGHNKHGKMVADTIDQYSTIGKDEVISQQWQTERNKRLRLNEFNDLRLLWSRDTIEYQSAAAELRLKNYIEDAAEEINIAVDRKRNGGENIRVINISIFSSYSQFYNIAPEGGDSDDIDRNQGFVDAITRTLSDSQVVKKARSKLAAAVEAARQENINVVTIAGNRFIENDIADYYHLKMPENASFNLLATDNMLIVGASASDGSLNNPRNNIVADFSAPTSKGGVPIDLIAPGENVMTRYGHFTGTSAAAPMATAMIMDMLKVNSKLTASDIDSIMKLITIDNPNVDKTREGYGSLNHQAALDAAAGKNYVGRWVTDDGFKVLSDDEKNIVIDRYKESQTFRNVAKKVLSDDGYYGRSAQDKRNVWRSLAQIDGNNSDNWNGKKDKVKEKILYAEVYQTVLKEINEKGNSYKNHEGDTDSDKANKAYDRMWSRGIFTDSDLANIEDHIDDNWHSI